MSASQLQNHGIVLFDGVCNYCSRWVDLILKHDKNDYFRFATLQSKAAEKLFSDLDIRPEKIPDSIVLIENDKVFFKSDAALRIQRKLKFPFPLLYLFIAFPKFIRDSVYNLIAKNRYKWFGKKEHCRIPVTNEEKQKFL